MTRHTTAPRKIRAAAYSELTVALVALAAAGGRPRCGDPDSHLHWLSNDPARRAQAAAWCAGCPVLEACSGAASTNGERFGVWGGVDRTPRPGRPRSETVP